MTSRALALFGALALLLASPDAHAAGKTTKKKTGPRPSELSRSGQAPKEYYVFLDAPRDTAKAGAASVKLTSGSLSKSFTRPGYVLDAPEQKAPSDSTELARWLRDQERTGIRVNVVLESLKESQENGNTRYDVTVKATIYTNPSGWLIMSTTGNAGAVADGMASDDDTKAAAIEAAVVGLVENIAAYLAKKPVPIDR